MTIGKNAYSSPQAQTYTELAKNASEEEEEADRLEYSESSNHSNRDWRQTNNNTNNTIKYSRTEESPFITSMHELKKHASRRRSRNSILMQERFRSSSSITNVTAARSFTADATASIPEHKPAAGDKHEHPATILEESSSSEIENKIPNGHVATNATPISSSPLTRTAATPPETSLSTSSMSAPEHIVIAIRLLRAHKAHVDQIMETLKLEMDTLRDFDRLLEEPGRPSEEELVNYYEAVDLCLEQRLSAGLDLRREMNRISAGDSAVAE